MITVTIFLCGKYGCVGLSPSKARSPIRRSDMPSATPTKPYRLATGEGLADVWWKTGRITVKAGPDETGGAFSQIEVDDPRGGGPPLHVHHNEDETFYVLEGE